MYLKRVTGSVYKQQQSIRDVTPMDDTLWALPARSVVFVGSAFWFCAWNLLRLAVQKHTGFSHLRYQPGRVSWDQTGF